MICDFFRNIFRLNKIEDVADKKNEEVATKSAEEVIELQSIGSPR